MQHQSLTAALCASVLTMGLAGTADAALVSRLSGQAQYDTVLNITWLTNANLAATNTFGVAGIQGDGAMNWNTANSWITAMNAAGGTGHLGVNDWRLPTLSPINGSTSFNENFSNNATTDFGSAGAAGWVNASGRPVSEMGYLFYVNLGNLGQCTPNNGDPASCIEQPGFGLAHTGPFQNIQGLGYWSGMSNPSNPSDAWRFDFGGGGQAASNKGGSFFAWAVRAGDVAAPVPLPSALLLMGTGLAGLLRMGRRQRRLC